MKDWQPYLKLDEVGFPCMAQQTYEPLISGDGTTFCKNYNVDSEYQKMENKPRPLYTKEIVDWFFQNELTYLELFKDKKYAHLSDADRLALIQILCDTKPGLPPFWKKH